MPSANSNALGDEMKDPVSSERQIETAEESGGRKLRVCVLFGGRSAEHEISIMSAKHVLAAIDRERFDPVLVGIGKDGQWRVASEVDLMLEQSDPRLLRLHSAAPTATLVPASDAKEGRSVLRIAGAASPLSVDVVFPILHGPYGEDGSIQGLLTLADVPFVGSGILASAIGMDKDVMKRLLSAANIPVVRHVTLRAHLYRTDPEGQIARGEALGFPVFVKPANLGSSVGVSRAVDQRSLGEAIELAFRFDEKVLVEAAVVSAKELECAVLGNEEPLVSGVGQIVVNHPDGFYSYDAKYIDEDGAQILIPAEIDAATEARIRVLAREAFVTLECTGLARVDFFVAPNGDVFVNEINTMPGFTGISMAPKLWQAAGYDARRLVTTLIDLALERAARRRRLRTSL